MLCLVILTSQAEGNNRFHVVADPFCQRDGLPFAEVLPAEIIEQAFVRNDALFGQADDEIFSTQIVLWAFLQQVLQDGKGAACAAVTAAIAPAARVTDETLGSATAIELTRYGAAKAEWITLLNNCPWKETGIGATTNATIETFDRPRKLRLDFESSAHTYLARVGEYLGKVETVSAEMPGLAPLIVARLDYKVNSIRVHCNGRHPAGKYLAGTVTLSTTSAPADHVIRLDVYDPDGTWCHWYSKNLVAKAGVAAFDIPFALNDPRGRWKLAVRDVVTGLTSEKTVTLSRQAK